MTWGIFDLGPRLRKRSLYIQVAYETRQKADASLRDLLKPYSRYSFWRERIVVLEMHPFERVKRCDEYVRPNPKREVATGKLELDGERHCLPTWARIVGIGRATLRKRLLMGWSVEATLVTPKARHLRCT